MTGLRRAVEREHFPLDGQKASQTTPKLHLYFPLLAVLLLLGYVEASAALEDECRAFEAMDAANPPPTNAILFVRFPSRRGCGSGWPMPKRSSKPDLNQLATRF